MSTKHSDTEIMVIFSGSPFDAGIVKEILVDHGIEAFTRNELMGTIAPWYVSSGGVDPVEVEILRKDQVQASQLIEAYKSSKRS